MFTIGTIPYLTFVEPPAFLHNMARTINLELGEPYIPSSIEDVLLIKKVAPSKPNPINIISNIFFFILIFAEIDIYS